MPGSAVTTAEMSTSSARISIYVQTGILNHVLLTLPDDCRAAFSIVLVGNQIDSVRAAPGVLAAANAPRTLTSVRRFACNGYQ
jgi:hypothetical protein